MVVVEAARFVSILVGRDDDEDDDTPGWAS